MSEAISDITQIELPAAEPLNVNALNHTSKLIGAVTLDKNILVTSGAVSEVSTYLDDVVYPALLSVKKQQNDMSRSPRNHEYVTGIVKKRYDELFAYITGSTLDKIALSGEIPRKEMTVKVSIDSTIKLLKSHESWQDPELILKEFLEYNPSAKVAQKAKVAHGVGSNALRGGPSDYNRNRSIEGKDSVALYLEEIARTDLIDAAKEVELSQRIEAGLVAQNLLDQGQQLAGSSKLELEWLAQDGEAAKELFVTANLRLVVSLARKYPRAPIPLIDLIQEGNTGLMHAVDMFDYTKGYKFSTYATWWIKQRITRYISQQGRTIRLPSHINDSIGDVKRTQRQMEHDLGREPELHEVALKLGMEEGKIIDLLTWGREPASLDTPIDDSGETVLGDLVVEDTVDTPDQPTLLTDFHEHLDALLQTLTDREADIIRLRYKISTDQGMTFKEIGAVHGLSAERVRQIERQALQKLREMKNAQLLKEYLQ